MLLSWTRGTSFAPLGYGIPLIILSCSEEQMSWVNTGWRVAFVAHEKPFRDSIVGEFPGNPVRIRSAECAVTVSNAGTDPNPTTAIWFWNVKAIKSSP